eukprot:UN33255
MHCSTFFHYCVENQNDLLHHARYHHHQNYSVYHLLWMILTPHYRYDFFSHVFFFLDYCLSSFSFPSFYPLHYAYVFPHRCQNSRLFFFMMRFSFRFLLYYAI